MTGLAENVVQQAQEVALAVPLIEAEFAVHRTGNERGVLKAMLWDMLKRLCAGVKATFGDDSTQYEMVGGTRISDKKKAARKPPVT